METFKINNKLLIVTFLILLINIACDKVTEYDGLSGQLIGYVTLYSGERISDHSGVEIVFEGSNPEMKAISDESGQFIIDDLKSGIYNIVFNKDGFGEHKIIGYQFVGGNKPATIYRTQLFELSNVQIDNLEITDLERQYYIEFKVSAKVSNQDGNTTSLTRFYLSNEPEVSYKNYISTDISSNFSGTNDWYFFLRIDTLKFPIGSELYLIMYPTSDYNQFYIDIDTGRNIYSSVNINKPSDVVNITIPEVESPWLKK